MRAGLLFVLLAGPAPALAQAVPGPECRFARVCQGSECRSDQQDDGVSFAAAEGGIRMTNPVNPQQTMILAPVPGEGTATWTGRSARTGGMVMLSQGAGSAMALTIHDDRQDQLSMTITLDCTPIATAPPAPTKGR